MNEGVIAAFQKMVPLAWELTFVFCRIIGIHSLRRVVDVKQQCNNANCFEDLKFNFSVGVKLCVYLAQNAYGNIL